MIQEWVDNLPAWFWALDYLLAPFLAVILSSMISIGFAVWMHFHAKGGVKRQNEIMGRMADALERIADERTGSENIGADTGQEGGD